MLERFAIITAGGLGVRMNEAVPKQFLPLGGKSVMMYAIEPFSFFCKEIIVSLPKDYFSFWEELQTKYHFSVPHKVVAGGETRFESVKNALAYLPAQGWVAIHDAVRPFVSKKLIEKCFHEAEKYGNAVASLPMTESLRMKEGEKNKSVDRSLFYRMQTPQIFRCEEIKEAYNQDYRAEFTDDASILESQGKSIHLVEGEEQNRKITSPIDRVLAENFIMNLK